MTKIITEFTAALLSLDRLTVKNLLAASSTDWTPLQSVEKLIAPSLEHIGEQWERGDVALSQVYMASRICEEIINASLSFDDLKQDQQLQTAIVVLEDFHQLGKRIVYSVLRSGGIDVKDFGTMKVDDLVARVIEEDIGILLISVLMLPSALKVKEVVAKLIDAGAQVKVIVGGAPFRFDTELWQELGAHAMGKNAMEALELVNNLKGGQS